MGVVAGSVAGVHGRHADFSLSRRAFVASAVLSAVVAFCCSFLSMPVLVRVAGMDGCTMTRTDGGVVVTGVGDYMRYVWVPDILITGPLAPQSIGRPRTGVMLTLGEYHASDESTGGLIVLGDGSIGHEGAWLGSRPDVELVNPLNVDIPGETMRTQRNEDSSLTQRGKPAGTIIIPTDPLTQGGRMSVAYSCPGEPVRNVDIRVTPGMAWRSFRAIGPKLLEYRLTGARRCVGYGCPLSSLHAWDDDYSVYRRDDVNEAGGRGFLDAAPTFVLDQNGVVSGTEETEKYVPQPEPERQQELKYPTIR